MITDQKTCIFSKPHYVQVLVNQFDIIEMDISLDTGKPAPLQFPAKASMGAAILLRNQNNGYQNQNSNLTILYQIHPLKHLHGRRHLGFI